MIASEGQNGVGTGLRNELWMRVQSGSPQWLPDSTLKQVLADVIGGYTWVPRPAAAVVAGAAASAAAAAAPATPTSAPGWVTVWSDSWRTWLHRNNAGIALTVNPAESAAGGGADEPQRTGTQLGPHARSHSSASPRDAPPRSRPAMDRT
jgi:hypothetical protein